MASLVDGNGGGSRLVVTELSHIKELVKQLDVHLGGSPDLKHLAKQIFTVTERSIGMIRSGHFDGRKRSAADAGIDSPTFPSTPSPRSGVSKKRKMMGKGELRVRVSSAEGGADTPVDDGFSWRKYGQKEILGSQNPRAYYRCTYKSQGCSAIKQVQRADEDPAFFDVTYHGTHTCVHKTVAPAANVEPATPNPDASSRLKSLSSGLTVNTTEGLMSGPQQDSSRTTPFSFSPAVSCLTPPEHFPSSTPSTPENCFGQGASFSPSQLELSPATSDYILMDPFEAESEYEQIVSALTAAASMQQPAMDGLDFFDPNFDVSIFFASDGWYPGENAKRKQEKKKATLVRS